jgi:hypothetical protein
VDDEDEDDRSDEDENEDDDEEDEDEDADAEAEEAAEAADEALVCCCTKRSTVVFSVVSHTMRSSANIRHIHTPFEHGSRHSWASLKAFGSKSSELRKTHRCAPAH